MTERQAGAEEALIEKKRLPGFEGEWETKQLCEIADVDPDNLPSNTDPSYSFNYISLEQVDNGHLIGYSEEVFSAAPSRARRVLRYGDVLMSTVRPNLMAHLHYREQIKNAVCSTGFSVLRAKSGLADSGFLFAHLFGSFVNKQIERMLAGSNYPAISSRDVKQIEITCPPLPEQRAIAAALSDADGLIRALDALIAKKRAIKQAAMQQLLTGKKRLPGFSGEWETKRFGDTITFLPTANYPRADLTDNGNIQYIHYGDVHAQSKPVLDCNVCVLPFIDREKIGNAAYLEDGDLIMVDASEDLEGTGKSVEVQGVTGKHVIAGLHTMLCRGNPDQWAKGFKAYLQFIPAFKLALNRVATGISVYGISKIHIAEIKLSLPSVAEQEAIVSILSDMDAEIAALERRREKAEQIKQGMMQQLLTGRIRLVEPPEVVA